MFRPRRARPVWGTALGRVSNQSDHSPPAERKLWPSGFTGNARNTYLTHKVSLSFGLNYRERPRDIDRPVALPEVHVSGTRAAVGVAAQRLVPTFEPMSVVVSKDLRSNSNINRGRNPQLGCVAGGFTVMGSENLEPQARSAATIIWRPKGVDTHNGTALRRWTVSFSAHSDAARCGMRQALAEALLALLSLPSLAAPALFVAAAQGPRRWRADSGRGQLRCGAGAPVVAGVGDIGGVLPENRRVIVGECDTATT